MYKRIMIKVLNANFSNAHSCEKCEFTFEKKGRAKNEEELKKHW